MNSRSHQTFIAAVLVNEATTALLSSVSEPDIRQLLAGSAGSEEPLHNPLEWLAAAHHSTVRIGPVLVALGITTALIQNCA